MMRVKKFLIASVLARPVMKLTAVIAALLAFGLTVWHLWGLPAPREQNRVGPINGSFSIIKPPDWEVKIVHEPADSPYRATITLFPPRSIGREQRIFAGLLSHPPDLERLKAEGFSPGTFQQQEALIRAEKLKREFVWRALFQRQGNWFEISLRLQHAEDVASSDFWPYLTSFQAEPTHLLTTALSGQ